MEIGTMVAGLFALHAVALLFVPAVHTEFAKKPHLAAHFVATLVGFAALAAFGTTLWLSGVATGDEDCVTNHISGYCEGGARIAHGMMAFQTYEVSTTASSTSRPARHGTSSSIRQVLLALYVPKLRGPSGDMLVHHLATLSLATLGAGYGYLHFYAPFFFGLTELSSVRTALTHP